MTLHADGETDIYPDIYTDRGLRVKKEDGETVFGTSGRAGE